MGLKNERYSETEDRILDLVEVWEHLFDLPGIEVTHKFVEALGPGDDPTIIATTNTSYVYRDAVISWYMPAAARMADRDLENTLVHEYCHILLNPCEQKLKQKDYDSLEAATENVCRALLRTRNDG